MKFKCEEISISDEELGLTIIFAERHEHSFDYEEIVNSDHKYIFLQLSYPEDEFETFHGIVEFSDFKKSGVIDEFKFHLSKDEFVVISKDEEFKCLLDVSDDKFIEIKDVLKNIIMDKNKLSIVE